MSLIVSASESLKRSNRRILVTGPRGTGKTTFSVSASSFAGDSIEGPHRICEDVLIVNGDNEGHLGAMNVGLEPRYVIDAYKLESWFEYKEKIAKALIELLPKFKDGTIKVIVIDLAYPARLIEEQVKPAKIPDWGIVKREGTILFQMFARIPGVTIIGNAQLKASAPMLEGKIPENRVAARTVGGEMTDFTLSLGNGVGELWKDNCSFILSRKIGYKKDAYGEMQPVFGTTTRPNSKVEVKNRAIAQLAAVEPGNTTLHALLKKAYGENI